MRQKQLNDLDPFPFGEHKGRPMMKVPASYLDWLRSQPWLSEWPDVAEYIERSARAIESELKAEGKRSAGCSVPRAEPDRATNMSSPTRIPQRQVLEISTPQPQVGDKSARAVNVPPGFRRLNGKELVWDGDYVADGRFELIPWNGPGGFQADSFAVPIYRKEEPEAFDPNSTIKPRRKGKHR